MFRVIKSFFVELNMAITRKNRLTPQDIEDVIACGYPLAQIAREAGVDRISLSKFRNHGQALKAADQTALIAWLQNNDLWEEGGTTPAKPAPAAQADAQATQVLPRPQIAITIGDEVPEEDIERLAARADKVVEDIKNLAVGKLAYDDFIFQADEPNESSKGDHQKLIAALAEFALLQFRMQGNDLAPPIPSELAEAGARLSTHAELLAREFPWPVGETEPEPLADSSDEDAVAAAASAGAARGKGPSSVKLRATAFG